MVEELKSNSNLEKILVKGEFAVTGELGPPKSANANVVRKNASYLKGNVDAHGDSPGIRAMQPVMAS